MCMNALLHVCVCTGDHRGQKKASTSCMSVRHVCTCDHRGQKKASLLWD